MLQSKPLGFATKSKTQELGMGLTERQPCRLAVGSNLLQRGYGTERVFAEMHVTLDVQVVLEALYACNLACWARTRRRMRARLIGSTTQVHNSAACLLRSSLAIDSMRNLRDLVDLCNSRNSFKLKKVNLAGCL